MSEQAGGFAIRSDGGGGATSVLAATVAAGDMPTSWVLSVPVATEIVTDPVNSTRTN
jgi:hypothetical protein